MNDFLYSVEREFDIPIEILWGAWTDADALQAWYHPTDLRNVPGSVVSEAVPGGWWTCGVDVPEQGYVAYFYGRYLVVVDNARLEHTLHYTQSEEEFTKRDEGTPAHRVVVEFESRGFRSWVKYSQFGEMPVGQAALAQAGMESYFDSLEQFLVVS
ncbi:MAG: SRPBCC family protein [Actinomycetales bacterium]